ncbi:LppX_LprAFG lipoprotein [Thermoflexus sp.]|uniref:LppX_LprAFG lipoprotein n=4 Tax=Thermoflexus sp. TaxID=1969742 RepID=UPI0026337C8D|nr:LppX_LprAFG lipoprotein [Thermoflexus sp.]MCX7691202.1 LppX_LprAFG lipoprotein [Thermoflexus sp.]
MRRWGWLGLLWVLGLWLPGCRRAEPTPALTAAEIIARAAATMAGTRSVHFVLERTGAPDYLDAARLMMLRRVEGDLVYPDRLRGIVRVFSLGVVTEIRIVRVGDRTWIALAGVERWEELTPERGVVIDPRLFFDPERGVPALMARVPLQLVGREAVDGAPVYHLQGELASGPLEEWSVGLISGRLRADLWVDVRTFRIHRVRLMELESDPQDPTVWTLTLRDFDQPIEIRPPSGS